jgi:hypothetical protein
MAKLPLEPIMSARWPAFFSDESQGSNGEVLKEGQSYFQFLDQIAHRFDGEIFIEFANTRAFSFDPTGQLLAHVDYQNVGVYNFATRKMPPSTIFCG